VSDSFISRIVSGDPPRSRVLTGLLLGILICLALAPFLFPGTRSLNVAARICVFVVLAGSYDLLLGYTGIVSFAHTMFFGIGSYGVAIAVVRLGASWMSIITGSVAALALSIAAALLIGLLSLRVRAIFFSMITLAIASAFAVLASQLSRVTGGDEGLTLSLPDPLRPSFRLLPEPLLGVNVNGRILSYYLLFAVGLILFLVMLRIVNSPFGRVLQAIRENPFRAEALGYRTVIYRSLANCVAAVLATAAGIMLAIWLRFTSPDATLSFAIMLDLLLMVVMGGMGTLYGPVLGAVLFVVAETYLQELMRTASAGLAGLPLLPSLFHPDRWLLWLGALFILSVYFFPTGIVGKLRDRAARPAERP
jgi:branched-chain amino acid transport system permease protein